MRCLSFLSLLLMLSAQAYSISVQLESKDAACGNNNGSINASAFGGTPPYAYQWSSGQSSAYIDNLAPGTYTITVVDAMSDTATASATINNTPEITGISLSYIVPPFGNSITHPCNNQCNGIGYLSEGYMNGTPPYSVGTSMGHTIGIYAPANIHTVEGICSPDIYTVFITDALGCTGTGQGTINYPYTSFDNSAVITAACNGAGNGQVIFNLLNNQGIPYQIDWTGPTTGSHTDWVAPQMTGLMPGTYTVTMINTYAVTPCDTVITVIVPAAGFCGTISGDVYLDSTANCTPDTGEPLVPARMIEFTPGPYYAVSDNAGHYTAYLPYGTYDLSTMPSLNINPVCTATGITLSAVNNSITGINLGDSAVTSLDLSLHLASGPARPGFSYKQYVVVDNHSFTPVPSAEVVLDYDPVLVYNSASVPGSVTGSSQVTLQMPYIGGFQHGWALVSFTIPPNPLLIGQIMNNMATVNANLPETNLGNNTDILQQLITGSYDPNEKSVWPAFDVQHTYLADVDTMLRYTITFQNTGNDTAFTVVLTDTLDQYLDLSSLQVTGYSHPCVWEIVGQNVLRVAFDNILLPDSNTNEPASHGLFSFTIRHFPSILQQVLPYMLENTANIYFDFNPPIITNPAFNTVDISVGNSEDPEAIFSLYPNPANHTVTLVNLDISGENRIILTDLPGRVASTWVTRNSRTELDVSALVSGVYLVILEGNGRRVARKLIVE